MSAYIYFHPSNCGMRDMVIGYAIREPKTILLDVCKYCEHPKFVSRRKSIAFEPIAAHILYSQAAPKDAKGPAAYGERLAEYIAANSLGEVHKSVALLNPDHGPNFITAFIWTPNWVGMKTWWEANKPAEKAPVPTVRINSSIVQVHQVCRCPKCCPPRSPEEAPDPS